MTVSSSAIYSGPYSGDGANRVWTRDFIAHGPTDIKVVHILSTGVEVEYLYDSGVWSGTGFGTEEGTVTFPLSSSVSPVSALESVRIERAFITTQILDLSAQSAYDPERVEVALDRRQFNELLLWDASKRSLKAPVGSTVDLTLPTPQPLYALGFNADGTALTTYPLPESISAPISRAVVDATDMVTAGIVIPLDGVQDAAPALQAACDYLAARGGALLTVRCPNGGGVRLNGRIRGGSGVSINFVGCKVYLGAAGGFSIRGAPASTGTPLSLATTLTAGSTACVVDTSPLGGVSLSTAYPVGSVINITSSYDSAGTDIDRARYTVTAVNNGTSTLTLHRGSDWTYTDGTVALEVSSLIASDTAEFDRTVTVADGTKFAAGDWVLVEDARSCAANGSTTVVTPIRNEMAQVIGIVGNVLTLHRKLEHDFDTASYARLTKINVVTGCEISGAAMVLSEEANSYNHHIAEMRYAVDCRFVDCAIDHDTSFSRPSNNFRIGIGTYDCSVDRCQVLRPRYYTEGQGYCFRAYGSTKSRFTYCYAAGGRTGFICSNGATDTTFDFCWAHDQANKGFDCHGQAEYTTTCQNCTVDGSNVNSDGTRYALAPGNPTYLEGSKRFSFLGGRIRYMDSGDIVLYACPPTSDTVISGVRIDSPYRVFSHFDINGGQDLKTTNTVVRDCAIFYPQEWVFYAEGKRFGSTVATLEGFYVNNLYIEGGPAKFINIDDCKYVWFNQVDLNAYSSDPTYTYLIYGDNVADFRVTGLRAFNCKHGLSLASVSDGEFEMRWRKPNGVTPTVVNDRGSNTNVLVEWTSLGTPTYGTPTGVTYVRCYP